MLVRRLQVRQLAVGMVAVAGLALAGCGAGSGSHVASAKGSSTTSSTLAPSTTTAGATTTTGEATTSTSATSAPSTTTAQASTPSCQHLTASSGGGQGAAGHFSELLLFRNTGSTTCEVSGYPGVDGVLTSGQRIAATRALSGFTGGVRSQSTPPVVTLQPGAEASADLEGTDVPEGTATSCPSINGLLVTPPNSTATVSLTFSGQDCSGLEVHPVVPGTTGNLGE